MVRVVGQIDSFSKLLTCRKCGAVNEYSPKDERALHCGKDYDGVLYVQFGFNCGRCGAEVVTKEI